MEHTASVSGDTLNARVWTGALVQSDSNICLEHNSSGEEVAATDNRSNLF